MVLARRRVECRRCAEDKRGQGHDPMDPAVMPLIRRQRRPPSASRPCIQSRQLPAHARDARVDQGLVADEPEEKADQDRREGREPRPLCRLPDGRCRRSETSVRRHPSAHRGTAAAAGHVNSVTSSVCRAFHEKQRETCVLMREKSIFLGARPRAGPPRSVSTSRGGSQRHFSLLKVSLWAQSQPQ
jgi:hypothetical protein